MLKVARQCADPASMAAEGAGPAGDGARLQSGIGHFQAPPRRCAGTLLDRPGRPVPRHGRQL